MIGGDGIDSIQVYFIPENYKGMVNLFGRSFRRNNLIQAGIFGAVIFIASFVLIHRFIPADLPDTIGWALVPAFCMAFFCITGIRGQSLLGYLSNMAEFYRTRRTAYFNPRIKLETSKKQKAAEPPVFGRIRNGRLKDLSLPHAKERPEQADEAVDTAQLFFEDDIGVVEKPYEYLTFRERRNRDRKGRRHGKEKKIAGLRL